MELDIGASVKVPGNPRFKWPKSHIVYLGTSRAVAVGRVQSKAPRRVSTNVQTIPSLSAGATARQKYVLHPLRNVLSGLRYRYARRPCLWNTRIPGCRRRGFCKKTQYKIYVYFDIHIFHINILSKSILFSFSEQYCQRCVHMLKY